MYSRDEMREDMKEKEQMKFCVFVYEKYVLCRENERIYVSVCDRKYMGVKRLCVIVKKVFVSMWVCEMQTQVV